MNSAELRSPASARTLMGRGRPGGALEGRAFAREDGTIIPLIVGFFVLALYVVAGSIAASDAFLDQRSVQSACDGAALAGANALDPTSVYGSDLGSKGILPVDLVSDAIAAYLAD